MSTPASSSRPDPIPWLLEGGAAERHAALTRLLGAPPDAPEVQEARRAIMTEGPVPRILAEQQADGHWEGPTASTGPSTAAPSGRCSSSPSSAPTAPTRACGPPARRSCAMRRTRAQAASATTAARRPAAASTPGSSPASPATSSSASSASGMLDDPRVQRALDWITTCQRFDDAEGDAPTGRPYDQARCAGAAIPAAWGRSKRSRRSRRSRPSAARRRCTPPSAPAPSSSCATTCTGAATTSPATPSRLAPLRLPAHVPDGRA